MAHLALSEEIERLEAVKLDELQESPVAEVVKPKRQRAKQIPYINRRLEVWGVWVLSNQSRSGDLAGSSMLGALIDGGGVIIRGTNPSAGSMPDDVFDTDRAVKKLGAVEQMLVHEQYLNLSSTAEQKAAAMGCSRRAYFDRLAKVHQKILFMLKPPKSVASRRSALGK